MQEAQNSVASEDMLDQLADAYRGKPVPDDWDPETHPLFMRDVETQLEEGNPLAQGIAMLQNPDPPEEIAERAKQKGNYFLKRGPRYYKDAVTHYTEAIEARGSDAKKNSIYHSNRAAVELLRKNYGKVVDDCTMAMKLDPTHIKAYFRCAKAQAALHKWALCLEVCEAGLKLEPDNKEILKEMTVAKEKLDAKRQEAKKQEAAKAKALLQDSKHQRAITKACQDRGVRMGECVYGGAVQGGQAQEAYIDGEGALHWPVLFLYDEFDQSDYFQDTHEDATVGGCLSMLFDPDAPPPEWDPTRRYRPNTGETKPETLNRYRPDTDRYSPDTP
jgi:tetratricopeptide (TPR) repeat protein